MKDVEEQEHPAMEENTAEDEQQSEQPHLSIAHAVGLMILLLIIQLLLSSLLSRTGVTALESTGWVNIALTHGISGYLTAQAGAILAGFSLFSLLALNRRLSAVLIPLTIATVGLTIICSEIANLLNAIKPVPKEYMEFIESLNRQNLAGILLCVGIIAPFVEELIFRGVILEGLSQRYHLKLAFVVSSLLFGVIHIFPWVIINAFLVGLFFAWLRLQTGSLWSCIFAHSLYNSLPFVLTRFWKVEIRGFTLIPDEGVYFQPLWLDVLGVGLFVTGVFAIRAITRGRAEDGPASADSDAG